MKCVKCGSDMADGKKFCENCGAPLMQNTNSEPQTNVNVETGKKKNTKVGLFIFIGVIVLAVIIGIICFVNSVKNKVADGLNNLNAMGEFVGGFVNEVQDEIEDEFEEKIEDEEDSNVIDDKGYNTKLEWKTPIVKATADSTYLKGELNIENIEDYDVYMSILKISTENIFVNGFKFKTTDEEVKIINKDCEDIKEDRLYTCYRYVYIVAPKGKDISNVGITTNDDKVDITTYIKDNNVEPIKEGKATFGDCITCSIDGIRCYMILLDLVGEETSNVEEISSPVFGEANEISASLMVAFVIEKLPERNAQTRDMFLTFSNDEKVDSDNTGDEGAILTEGIYIKDIYFSQFGLMNNDYIYINYIYKKDSKTLDEAKKIWENDKIGVKFLNKVEIDCMN